MPTSSSRPVPPRRGAQSVTSARVSQDEDRSRRMKQYLVAMGVRTLSFPVAVWAFVTERYVLAGIAAVLATIIPSFAVMFANAVDQRQQPSTRAPASPVQGLGPGSPSPPPQQEQDAPDVPDVEPPRGHDVITGTVVSRADAPRPPGAGSPGRPPAGAPGVSPDQPDVPGSTSSKDAS